MELEIRRHSNRRPWTYAALDRRQREIAAELVQNPGSRGVILLSELAPVITCGRRTPSSDLLLTLDQYRSLGVEIYSTDRGGMATYHGPGQWVVFVVDTLENLTGDTRGVRTVVEGLLGAALKLSKERYPESYIGQGTQTGVWAGPGLGKVASVGIHIEGRVVLHGLSFNVFDTPTSFMGLRPCGMSPDVAYFSHKADQELFLSSGLVLVRNLQEILDLPLDLESISTQVLDVSGPLAL